MPRSRSSKFGNDAKDTAQLASSLAEKAQQSDLASIMNKYKMTKKELFDQTLQVVPNIIDNSYLNASGGGIFYGYLCYKHVYPS